MKIEEKKEDIEPQSEDERPKAGGKRSADKRQAQLHDRQHSALCDRREIRFIDLFGGVGGFRLGLERANNNRFDLQEQTTKKIQKTITNTKKRKSRKFTCVWYNDIDKYATAVYNHRSKENHTPADIRKVRTADIPDFDMLCAGFPCQSFSIAGKRKGFQDTRGTLFFEICRIARDKRPSLLFLENVKGLLSHDKGLTFQVILESLDELGYDVEWQVLNSKHFGVPQNRERVFIVGHLGGFREQQVFPIGESSTNPKETERKIKMIVKSSRQIKRIYDTDGISPALHLKTGGWQEPKIMIHQGVSRKGEYGNGIKKNQSFTLDGSCGRDLLVSPTLTQELAHSWGYNFQNNLPIVGQIRRLTPRECERLQGFPDDWTLVPWQNRMMSDTQRYKMMGNAVTVNVIEAIGKRMLEAI